MPNLNQGIPESESWSGVRVSRSKVLRELKLHQSNEDFNDDLVTFYEVMGNHETYDGGEVLEYLGY